MKKVECTIKYPNKSNSFVYFISRLANTSRYFQSFQTVQTQNKKGCPLSEILLYPPLHFYFWRGWPGVTNYFTFWKVKPEPCKAIKTCMVLCSGGFKMAAELQTNFLWNIPEISLILWMFFLPFLKPWKHLFYT